MAHQTTAESQRFRLLRLTWQNKTFRFVGTDADGYLGVRTMPHMETLEAECREWFDHQLLGEPRTAEDGQEWRSYPMLLARRWLNMHNDSLEEIPWRQCGGLIPR